MTINLKKPDITELKPRITVFGVGGGGGNAVNNMINGGLEGVDFVVANTDAQALSLSVADKCVQMGVAVTEGLGAGSQPEIGRDAAEECIDEIRDYLSGTHMTFVTAGMGGGTGTGAAPVVARVAREIGVLTVGVVTKPFHFEGKRRMAIAEAGISQLENNVDTLIVIPNQNLFRIANDKTTFADAFGMADQVLFSGVACITDLMVKEGLINLDFADVRSVMREMGRAMMGTGEASDEGRAMQAAEAAISNPLLDESSMRGAQGLLISITGGRDLTLFEVDEAATRIREEVDANANIILGATFDEELEGVVRVSVVATGIDRAVDTTLNSPDQIDKNFSIDDVPTMAPIPNNNASRSSIHSMDEKIASIRKKSQANISLISEKKLPAGYSTAPISKNATVKDLKTNHDKGNILLERFNPGKALFSESNIEDEFKSALEEEMTTSVNKFTPPKPQKPDNSVSLVSKPYVADFLPEQKNQTKVKEKTSSSVLDSSGPISLLKRIKNGFVGNDDSQNTKKNDDLSLNKGSQHGDEDIKIESTPTSSVSSSFFKNKPLKQVTKPQESKLLNSSYNNSCLSESGNTNKYNESKASVKFSGENNSLEIPAFLRRQIN